MDKTMLALWLFLCRLMNRAGSGLCPFKMQGGCLGWVWAVTRERGLHARPGSWRRYARSGTVCHASRVKKVMRPTGY